MKGERQIANIERICRRVIADGGRCSNPEFFVSVLKICKLARGAYQQGGIDALRNQTIAIGSTMHRNAGPATERPLSHE